MAPALEGFFDTEDGAEEDEAGDVLVVDAVVEVEEEDNSTTSRSRSECRRFRSICT
jgi:hypothetical protein